MPEIDGVQKNFLDAFLFYLDFRLKHPDLDADPTQAQQLKKDAEVRASGVVTMFDHLLRSRGIAKSTNDPGFQLLMKKMREMAETGGRKNP